MVRHEEMFDVLGIAWLTSVLLLHFFTPLADFATKNRRAALLLVGALALIAVGNSLAHRWDTPRPGPLAQTAGYVFAVAGCLSVYGINTRMLSQHHQVRLFSERGYYSVLIFIFVVLPAIYAYTLLIINVLIWLPLLIVLWSTLIREAPSTKTHAQ